MDVDLGFRVTLDNTMSRLHQKWVMQLTDSSALMRLELLSTNHVFGRTTVYYNLSARRLYASTQSLWWWPKR